MKAAINGFVLGALCALGMGIAIPVLAHAKLTEVSSKEKTGHVAGFVKLATGNEIYIDYIKPAPGKPIAVLLNGLTYKVDSWDAFVGDLKGDGLGILRYDMQGQGETLLKYAPITAIIPLQNQVDDLKNLLDALQIQQPVHLVTLSYGGAVGIPFTAQNPDRVASLILMAPFVAPLPSQDDWIKSQINETRLAFPANPASDDDLYNYFLQMLVFGTYPAAEPVVLENPYILESIFHIVQGVRQFEAKDYISALPPGKVHLMVARNDQYVPAALHEAFWQALPKEDQASRLFIENSEHKIPEAVPSFSAAWVRQIMNGDPRISGGVTFEGSPADHKATAGSLIIDNLGD